MKLTHVLIAATCVSLIAVASCKKSSSPSVQSNLEAKWKVTSNALDVNGNGIMDASEITADTTNEIVTFNANGTVSISLMGNTVGEVLWVLTNNNTYLKITDTSSGGNTSYNHIDVLNSTTLTLKDTTGGTAAWTVFTKQ